MYFTEIFPLILKYTYFVMTIYYFKLLALYLQIFFYVITRNIEVI